MPRGAADQRGEEMAAMESVLHARRTDPRVGEWLAAAEAADEVAARRSSATSAASYDAHRARCRPGSRPRSPASPRVAQGIWADARAAEDFAAFAADADARSWRSSARRPRRWPRRRPLRRAARRLRARRDRREV